MKRVAAILTLAFLHFCMTSLLVAGESIRQNDRIVFLGDSITFGTLPTPGNQVYRQLLTNLAKAQWPSIEGANCSNNGDQTDDFFAGTNQIPKCFPAAEPKKTLVVITVYRPDPLLWQDARTRRKK